MTDTYRGLPHPEVYRDGNLFIIAEEDTGWFSGYTEEAVFAHWRNRVDSLIARKLLLDKRVAETETGFACVECGSLLFDVVAHGEFHGYDLTLAPRGV